MQRSPKITLLHTLPNCVARVLFFFALICLTSVIHASSPPADSVHVCLPFDYEQWRRDHPRPAAKRLANLNVGEPRTVRMIYFLPNDRAFRQEVVDSMKVTIRQIQVFYADQMAAHGYGRQTFRFETDAQGEPVVHRIDGQHPDSHYLDDTFISVWDEIQTVFNVHENIYFVVIDNEADLIVERATGRSGAGRAFQLTKNSGYALVPGGFSFNTAAHELGHTFGLAHDFRKNVYIMSYGGLSQSRLSPCHAEFLTVHPYFNPAVSIEAGVPPTIELLSSSEYPAGSRSVAVRLRLHDSDGMHQVFLRSEERGGGYFDVWACHSLTGKRDDEVVFEYDGYSPSHAFWGIITSLSTKNVHPIIVSAVDLSGNISDARFKLSATDPNEPRASTIEIIGGDDQQGALGTVLIDPLIVEVKDQHGQPLPGETVQFGVIVGGARLSGRYLVQNATTNANGRAELTLTLGTTPETIVVRVSVPEVPECQPVHFNATAVGVRVVSSPSGEPQKWHLPDGAIARLGNGVMGGGDRAVLFSPDGQHIAVASGIGIWLYDVAMSSARTLLPTTKAVSSVAFSTDGTRLASGAANGKIDLWDVATGTKSAELSFRHPYDVSTVAFSRDGTRLAAGSKTQIVKLWDVESGREIYTYEIERESSLLLPVSVAFSPDDAILAVGSADGLVRLLNVATGETIATLPGHQQDVLSVSFSRDGRTLASGSKDGTIKLWDVARQKTIMTLFGHTIRIYSVQFSRDGRTLASASNNVMLWDVATGTPVATLNEGHAAWVTTVSFSPDGTIIASGSPEDGNIVLWDVATKTASTVLGSGHVDTGQSVSFSRDDEMLVTSSEDGAVKLWDAETGRHIRSFGIRLWGIDAVAVSPDGTTLAAGSLDNSIDLWNIATGDKIASFTRGAGQVISLAFSPDGTKLAAGDPDGIALWDVASVSAASAALGGDVVYGDMATAHYISTPLGATGWVQSLSFSKDGRTLASAELSAGSVVNLWDASTLSHLTTLEEGYQVAFSPDGTTLAYGNAQQLKLWDEETGAESATLLLYDFWINSLSFSPDRTLLAIGSHWSEVGLLDMASREIIATMEGHVGSVSSLSFSPDGMTLASGSGGRDGDGTVLLWDMSPYITPQTPASVLTPDFDGDGTVGVSDFLLFVNQFGLSQGDAGYDARYDLDGDGTIGIGDFLIFGDAFGQDGT